MVTNLEVLGVVILANPLPNKAVFGGGGVGNPSSSARKTKFILLHDQLSINYFFK